MLNLQTFRPTASVSGLSLQQRRENNLTFGKLQNLIEVPPGETVEQACGLSTQQVDSGMTCNLLMNLQPGAAPAPQTMQQRLDGLRFNGAKMVKGQSLQNLYVG